MCEILSTAGGTGEPAAVFSRTCTDCNCTKNASYVAPVLNRTTTTTTTPDPSLDNDASSSGSSSAAPMAAGGAGAGILIIIVVVARTKGRLLCCCGCCFGIRGTGIGVATIVLFFFLHCMSVLLPWVFTICLVTVFFCSCRSSA
eukprot:m.203713 g.203713  ORF g.203713 m.203713 type:complete len:144 (+) comp18457_c0_seq3:175-606(+)